MFNSAVECCVYTKIVGSSILSTPINATIRYSNLFNAVYLNINSFIHLIFFTSNKNITSN